MGSQFIKQPNGLYARFSDVVDSFTHFNLTPEDALKVYQKRILQGTEKDVEAALKRADNNPNRWEEALNLVHRFEGKKGVDEALEHLKQKPLSPLSEDRHLAIRRILLPKDTNHRGEVFGGAILAEIDLAGAVEARKHTKHDVATRFMNGIEFKHPVGVGDVVSLYTTLEKIGTTSLTIKVEVEFSRDGEPAPIAVVATQVVYVAVQRNEDGSISKVNVRD